MKGTMTVSIVEIVPTLVLGLGRSVAKIRRKLMTGFVVNVVFPTLTGETAARNVNSQGQ